MIFRSKKQPQPGLLFSSLIVLLILTLSGCGQSASSSNPGTDTQSQNGTSQDGNTQDGTSQDGTTQDGSTQDGSTQDGTSQDGTSQDGTSQDGTNQDGTNQDGTNQDGTNQDGTNQDGTNQDGTNQDGTNQDGATNMGNQQPTASITAPQSVTSGETVTLDGSGSSDPEGDTITYLWTQTQGDNITLANNTESTLSFVAPTVQQATTYTFKLSVNDGSLSDERSVQFMVLPVETTTDYQVPANNFAVNGDVEDNLTNWGTTAGEISRSTSVKHGGAASAYITNRTAAWHGLTFNVGRLTEGNEYEVAVWVKLPEGSPDSVIILTAKRADDGDNSSYNEYTNMETVTASANKWTLLKGFYTQSGTPFEHFIIESSDDKVSFYADDFSIGGEVADDSNPVDPDTGTTPKATSCDIPAQWDTNSLTQHVVGNGTPESCTSEALSWAVVDGGYVTFNCGGNKTISVTSEIPISSTTLTVIDGGGTVTLDGGDNNRIFKLESWRSLSLRNLTLKNGHSVPPDGESPIDYSGGAVVGGYLSKLEIINSTLSDNKSGGGGAVYVGSAAELTIIDSKFTGNTSWYGGAVLGMLSGITIVNSTFTNNSAPKRPISNEFGVGGAITTDGAALDSPDGGTISICGTTFKNNSSDTGGGGVWLWAYALDKIIVKDSTFEGNTAKGIGGAGRVSIGPTDTSHQGNTITKPGSINITDSSFLSNASTEGNGGALYMDCYGECNVNNSTFYGNSAGGVGAAIQHVGWGEDVGHQATSVHFNNVTFADNENANSILFGSKFVLNNTVLVSHTSQGFCSDPASNSGHNLLQYSSLGSTVSCINENVITSDPLLAAPADNGGSTHTMLPASNSPLIDGGTNCLSVDQRGNSRDSGVCDIGAVELGTEIAASSTEALSSGCGAAAKFTDGKFTLDSDGTTREFLLRVPANYDPNMPHDLIVGLHWRGGQASDVYDGEGAFYGLQKLYGDSAIYVAPNGLDAGWANYDDRDIHFIRSLVDQLKGGLCVDNSRIFATGFSFGGMMSNAIGCQMGDLFRAVAPMSGSLWSGCADSENKVATIMMHAKDDSVVGYQFGEEARDKFLSKNGCSNESVSIGSHGCVEYLGCDSDYPVVWCGSEDGGHWPKPYAGEEIKTFFDRF
jgi:poly(3-hydroxybutyrate) depolymerase